MYKRDFFYLDIWNIRNKVSKIIYQWWSSLNIQTIMFISLTSFFILSLFVVSKNGTRTIEYITIYHCSGYGGIGHSKQT